MSLKSIVLVYEPEQVGDVLDLCESNTDCSIVSLSYWAERALRKAGREVLPLTNYVAPTEDDAPLMELAGRLAHDWYRCPQMDFFKDKEIMLGEVFEPMIDSYFGQVLYYLRILERIHTKHPELRRIYIPHTHRGLSATSSPLAAFELTVLMDTARYFAGAHDLEFYECGTVTALPKEHVHPGRNVPAVLFALFNAVVSLVASRKNNRIYATEYWTHIVALMEQLKDTELVLMERKQILSIPFKTILRHRMRFMHPVDVTTGRMRSQAFKRAAEFKEQWVSMKETVAKLDGFTRNGFWWWSLVEPAFSYLVTDYSKRILTDAEAFRSILKKEKITKVLQRASIGVRQYHFFLLSQIAREMSVPSIELQHATEVVDPRSIFSKISTDYLAAYGNTTRDVMMRLHGYTPERIRAIGSPRFDGYASSPLTHAKRTARIKDIDLDPRKPILFVSMPSEMASLYFVDFDSYHMITFLRELAGLTKMIPEIQFILKFRPSTLTSDYRDVIEDLFGDKAVAVDTRPYELMQIADLVLSGNSTLFLESLIAERPTILYPLRTHDTYTRATYEAVIPAPPGSRELHSLVFALLGSEEKRGALVEKQQQYFREQYSFDGRSSERMAAMLLEPLTVQTQKKKPFA